MENGLIGWLNSMVSDVTTLVSTIAVCAALGVVVWTAITKRTLAAVLGSAIVAALVIWLVDSMGVTDMAGLFEGTFTQ